MSEPLISIIVATYNRSNVLALAIETVRWQTRRDWELLVVGDACTDDTEQVVASLAGVDSRIHFFNLEQNVGEQSGPNNAGFQQARGRYIAYLNHDDLWLPDHLETLVTAVEQSGADLVFSLIDLVQREGLNLLSRVEPVTRHAPPIGIPASCWLLRREMIEELGGWRFYQECYSVPSQDWLFRAWKAGKNLYSVPRLTVVAIQSGARRGAYSHRQDEEHQMYFGRITHEPDFREKELAAMGFASEAEALRHRQREMVWWRRPLYKLPLRLARRMICRLCLAAGIDPSGVLRFVLDRRKGGFIDHLRQRRGLPALERINQPSRNR
ncbi:MAG: glycosyltransferase family 2 protein [Planctomycetota bacterium]